MPIGTDFLPFATGPGANIVSQASYAADPLTGAGNQPGIARSNVNNKALRQGTFVAAGVSQFITEQLDEYVFDDANLASWVDKFRRALLSLQPRITLYNNTDFYVATSGNDANDGLTLGTPWATLQHAANTIVNKYDVNGNNVTIHIANGTYSFFSQVGNPLGIVGPITWLGNDATPDNVVIQSASSVNAAVTSIGGYMVLQGIKLTTTGGPFSTCLSCVSAGSIIPKNVDFGSSTGAHIIAQTGGLVQFDGGCVISGGATYHIVCANNGFVGTGAVLGPGEVPWTFVVSGTPTFSLSFVECSQGSVFINSSFMTYSGAANGKKFQVNDLGGINTAGAGVNFFPGNVAGTTSSIGFYA
jgi:hypothetical protein